jgi:hypothetical protein
MSLFLALWLVPAAAGAESFPACVKRTSESTFREPANLQLLFECQKKKLARFISNHQAQHGDLPSDETVARWEELQRGEVQDYISRRQGASVLERAPAAPAAKNPGKAKKGDSLKRSLERQSEGGRKGITPEMAQEIIDHITDQQGFISRDMAALLVLVRRDGADLSEDTVRELKAAARQADAAGLDLGVESDIRDFLLKKEEKEEAKPSGP